MVTAASARLPVAMATLAPSLSADRFQAPTIPEPPGPATGTRQRFWDRITPKELAGAIALHVGGGALIAGGIGAGIAALAGGTVLTGLAIGAGIGAVLGGAFLAAVLSIAG
jgi:hypothetical protein